jgi:hypothetical protein
VPARTTGPHNLGLREDGFRSLLWRAYEAAGWQVIRSEAWIDHPEGRFIFATRMRRCGEMMGLHFEYRVSPDDPAIYFRATALPDATPSVRPSWSQSFVQAAALPAERRSRRPRVSGGGSPQGRSAGR